MTKMSVILSSTLFLFGMMLSIIITPFIANAEAREKRYVSYNTRTGEVTYYDILPVESERTNDLRSAKSGSDRYYDPSEN